MITQHLFSRMREEDCLRPGDRESVAYRIAEVMVLAKQLYVESLPRLMGESTETLFNELAGLRMALLNMRDLITEFDEAFLEAMLHQREADEAEAPPDDDEDVDEVEEEPDPDPPTNGAA